MTSNSISDGVLPSKSGRHFLDTISAAPSVLQSISLTVDDLPIVVQDLDDSAASRLFIDAFRASITFRVIGWPVDEHPEAAFKANAARAALIIPKNFGRDMARGYTSPVQ